MRLSELNTGEKGVIVKVFRLFLNKEFHHKQK